MIQELMHKVFKVHYAKGRLGLTSANRMFWIMADDDLVGVRCVYCKKTITREGVIDERSRTRA
jgi:hypothetical protein